MSVRGGGQELLGPGAVLSSPCSFTEQAGSSWDFFFAPVKLERVQKLPRRIAWKKSSLLLMQPLRLQRKTLGNCCAWTRLAGSLSIGMGLLAAAASLSPVDNSSSPISLSCISHSAPPALTEVFQLGLHTEHGFKPTALGVSPAYVNSVWTKITSSVEELF